MYCDLGDEVEGLVDKVDGIFQLFVLFTVQVRRLLLHILLLLKLLHKPQQQSLHNSNHNHKIVEVNLPKEGSIAGNRKTQNKQQILNLQSRVKVKISNIELRCNKLCGIGEDSTCYCYN